MELRPAVRIIIDTDPGIDDVVTLALAAQAPEIDLVAVTTTYGNAPLPETTRNAVAVLQLAGRSDVAVTPGAARPLVRELVTAPETHGDSGVGYASVPEADRALAPNEFVLLDRLEEADKPVTLVTLGPLTNLAHALGRDAHLVRDRVERHIGMFGNLWERGNTNRWADFNAWCDPEALERVLDAQLPSEMVGLDVTRRMTITAQEVERLAASSDPLTSWLAQALRFYVAFHRSQERLDGCVLNDVLTIGELLDPGLLGFEDSRIQADLDDGEHRGHTKIVGHGKPNPVALTVDVSQMRRLLDRVFGAGWQLGYNQGEDG